MTHENPFAGQGPVLLDIGGDVGALVVEMPVALTGREIEIRPVDGAAEVTHGHHHPHVATVPRAVDGRMVPSLVFAELTAGEYELYEKPGGKVLLTAAVTGGAVSHATWPS